MEKYGGKLHKRREETRERHLRDSVNLVKRITVLISLSLWFCVLSFLGYKYHSAHNWNEDIVYKTRPVWKSLDILEADLMSSSLFLKGCRKDIVFQESEKGFDLQLVQIRNQSMEILSKVEPYTDQSVAVYIGSGIRPGDELILCNEEEEKVVKLQVIRSNPKFSYHYLVFPEPISLENKDLPANLLKLSKVQYHWEKVSEGNEKLIRTHDGLTNEVLSDIYAHKIEYSLNNDEHDHFTIELTLNEKFANGERIQVKRVVPLQSFQRLPKELEGMIP
jgi:hypothetical protein